MSASIGGNVSWSIHPATGRPSHLVVVATMLHGTTSVAIPKEMTSECLCYFREWQRVSVAILYRIAAKRPDFRPPVDRVYRLQQMLAARPGVVARYLGNWVQGPKCDVGHLFSIDYEEGAQQLVACLFKGDEHDLLMYWGDQLGDLCSLEIMKAGIGYE